jgi:O-antigen/teichoic acid export membrane protein
MLAVMKGISDVGLYSVATNFIDEFLLISASASLVIFPLINKEKELNIY